MCAAALSSSRPLKSALTGSAAAATLALAAGLLGAAPAPVQIRSGGLGQALALAAYRAAPAASLNAASGPRRGSDGRYIYTRPTLTSQAASAGQSLSGEKYLRSGAVVRPRAVAGTPVLNEAVQTFDVFNPAPAFAPPADQGTSLTPTNLTPVWTADESTIVFSSNRTSKGGVQPDGRFHIWAIPVNGGTPTQLTSSTGPSGGTTPGTMTGEFYPALSGGNNLFLAFTSDAQKAGTQNLYRIPFGGGGGGTVNISDPTVTSLTIPTGQNAQIPGGTGFTQVGRPAFAGRPDEIVFSALTVDGSNVAYRNHYHLYYTFVSSGGSDPDPNNLSLPAKITDGPADDTDPAYSADAQFIAFASTASSIAPVTQQATSRLDQSLTLTTQPGTNRNLFLVGGGGRSSAFGSVTRSGAPLTITGTDNYGPAWSSLNRNAYLNPAPGAEYLAFSRGSSPTATHDIYYLQVLHNVDSGGESGRSNEAATTPLAVGTPVYRVNAGGAGVTAGTNTFTSDTGTPGVFANGGTAETITPAVTTNTINDPTAPAGIYNTDRNGTFSYSFGGLTPGVPYTVRVHLSDPKNSTIGKRLFTISVGGLPQTVTLPGGTQTSSIDIVQLAQSSPGRVDGVVTDSATTTPIAGATLTVTDPAGNAVTPTPSPVTTSAAPTADPAGGAPINYNFSVGQGQYTVTASAPGYPSKSQTLNVSSGAFLRADFALTQATGTVSGTVRDAGGAGLPAIPLTVIEAGANGLPGSNVVGSFATSNTGQYSLTLPVGSYYLTATPPVGDGHQVLTQLVTITAATPATSDFSLQSGQAVGTVGGLVSNSAAPTQPLGGVLVELKSGNTVVALTRSSTAAATPAAPNGDGAPLNYSILAPVASYTLQFITPGYTPQAPAVTVINTQQAGTTAANAFVRKDAPLVSLTTVVGQNTAVVQDFDGSADTADKTDPATGIITPSGTIVVAFAPVANGGDPPIVQGIEILAGSSQLADPAQSSGLGANNLRNSNGQNLNAQDGVTPTLYSAIGGNGQVTLKYSAPNGTPSYYNIYRTAQGSGQEGNVPYRNNVPAASFLDTQVQNGVEYYYQVTAVYNEALTPEDAAANPVVKLNTDDNTTAAPGGLYEDAYPTWAPGLSIFSIAYSSNRSVTYNNPVNNLPSETAISVPQNGALGGGGAVGAAYTGIFESQVLNLDPPTLVPYSGSEIVHIADENGVLSRANLSGGRPMSITVRLSDREAGIDDDNVYVQIKDPDSKYQDAQQLEHKVFARDSAYRTQSNNPNLNSPDSGSSSLLFNGGGSVGYNYFASGPEPQRGAIGGVDTSGDTIAIGVVPTANQNSTNPTRFGDDGKPLVDSKGNPQIPPGFDPQFFIPTGPEYECQTVNPVYATNAAGLGNDTSPSDYGTPYYLAGVDDQRAFSGFPAAGAVQGTVSASSPNAAAGTAPQPIGGATITVTDYFTGAPVATTPSAVISSAQPTVFPDGTSYNFLAALAPGQYRITVTLNGYMTEIRALTINERGTSPFDVTLTPGTGSNDKSRVLTPATSGNGHPPRPTDNSTTSVNTTTTSGIPVPTTVFHPAEWLKLTRLPNAQQDGGGGVLYSVRWTPPVSSSDYYLDVIAYDKAAFPNFADGTSQFSGERSNWRIYDNIWGFSTLRDIDTNKHILFVSDYDLGQKFAGTTFGGQNSLVNLVPKFYGAESYLTDTDVSQMPNATYLSRIIAGRKAPITEVLPLAALQGFTDKSASGYGLSRTLNGLGVGSYADANIDDASPIDGVPAVSSQQYAIWRTLSRGPVPQSIYQTYQPSTVTQPAVVDPTATPAVNYAGGPVRVANRCIVWSSPFAGDLLVGPGTITDPATQTALRAYVQAGGRLFITGQDIGSAVTQNGTTNNVAGSFLPDVLGATLVSPTQGTFNATGGNSIANNRVSNVAFFDGQQRMNFKEVDGGGNFNFRAPYQSPIVIGNDIGGNIFGGIGSQKTQAPLWRTDGSLDQLGPYATPFGVSNNGGQGNSVLGKIDTIAPFKTTSHTDLVLNKFSNPYGTGTTGDPNAANSPGGNGLLYYDDSGTGGTGAKVVYASFGFEGISTDYYSMDIGNPAVRYYLPHNQRQNMLHNIVCYLRTGSVQGTIRSTTGTSSPGVGIGGATVYLVSSNGTAIPGRGTFSATSDSTGNYRIDGVEPGTYTVAAYKNGFARAASNTTNTFTVEGDSTQSASINLSPAAAGSLTGTVTDPAGKLVAGATVTFTPDGGGAAQIATTTASGQYSLAAIPAGSYSGVATDAPAFGPSTPQTVVITASTPATANFALTATSATITGRVINTAGTGIASASVIFTTGSPATVVTTATTLADGTYTATVPAGSYTLTATANSYGNASVTVQAAGGNPTVAPDLVLGIPANGSLGGTVLSTTGTAPLAGATITITSAGTGVKVTATTVAAAAAAPDGGTLNYGPVKLAQGTYTVTASRGTVTTSPQTVTITAGTFTRQDFSGLTGLPAVHTFPAGLQFVSLPYNYASLGFNGVFGTINSAAGGTDPNGNRSHIALWDPVASTYVLDPTAPADAPRLGVGYWVFLKNSTAVTQVGATPTGTVSVALHPAWNMIGVPNPNGIPASRFLFMGSDGTPRTFAAAASSQYHLISPTLYRYDGTAYQPVASTDTLQPWTAYWIRVYADVTLQIPTGN